MRLKTKIIAAEVTNLTDARYFAAWGVDYISYVVDKENPNYIGDDGIKEIIDWTEGSFNLAHITSINNQNDLGSRIKNLNMSGVILDVFVTEDKKIYDISQRIYKTYLWNESLIKSTEELIILKIDNVNLLEDRLSDVKELCKNNEVYIDGNLNLNYLELLLSKIKPTGIVLRGGEEEKIGFKSYDELDKIFEYLEKD